MRYEYVCLFGSAQRGEIARSTTGVIEIDLVDLSNEDTQCGICFVDLDAAVGQIDDAGVLYVSMIIHSIPTATKFFFFCSRARACIGFASLASWAGSYRTAETTTTAK